MAKPVCGADYWADYMLVVNILNFIIHSARQTQCQKDPKRLGVSKLKQANKRHVFLNNICNNLGALQLSSDDPEEKLTVLQNAFHTSAFDIL